MASITPAPIMMNTAVLKVGTDNYEASVSKAELVPTTPVGRFKGIGGQTAVVAGTPDWAANLTYAQDTTTANALQSYLLENVGLVKSFELTPAAGGTKYTFDALIVPGTIGGEVAASDPLKADVSLEVVGQPVPVPAV